jgi:hypothetical protein
MQARVGRLSLTNRSLTASAAVGNHHRLRLVASRIHQANRAAAALLMTPLVKTLDRRPDQPLPASEVVRN